LKRNTERLLELEQQGGDIFFGEISFDIRDLMRRDRDGRGYINIIRLTDIQDKPKLFSTFMLSLLAEIYSQMPEKGDAPKPELVIFIDEAHLIFSQASKALLDQIENIVKLIRSKGVHALRAFTAVDRKAIKLAAENYPVSEFYKTDEIITSLGIGEALVTALSEKGIPTPLAATMLRAPVSRMDILSQAELDAINSSSELFRKYSQDLDRESAYEMLNRKIEFSEREVKEMAERREWERERGGGGANNRRTVSGRPSASRSRTPINPVVKVLTSATFIRGVLGILSKSLK
jgi:hypothetical protein